MFFRFFERKFIFLTYLQKLIHLDVFLIWFELCRFSKILSLRSNLLHKMF